jgi:hypothetical protein
VLYQLSYVSESTTALLSETRKPPHPRGGLSFAIPPLLPSSCIQRPRAGDGARTRDIKLGRLALYQLSYSREAPSLDPPSGGHRRMVGEGFEPSKACAVRFTV